MTTRTAMVVVTHLLGVGHLARMAALGRALVVKGWRVVLVSGGRPNRTVDVRGCELVQLPPVHCVGTDFATLLTPDGIEADIEYLATRTTALLAAFDRARPDVLITELFPFGRRALQAEFEAVLERAHATEPRPAILCSIRDVLNPPSRPEKAQSALARLGAFYDAVLFHGDMNFVSLSASWPTSPALLRRVKETGYLHDSERLYGLTTVEGQDEILISGGGSSAGLPLCWAALDAARHLPARRWRLLVGHGVPETDYAELRAGAPTNMLVERARPDFPELLGRAALSISQAGYNTVLDLAEAQARAILVPFAEGGEREQTLRAAELERHGVARVITAAEADGSRLAQVTTELLTAPRPDWSAIRREGARRTVQLVGEAADSANRRAKALARLDMVLAKAKSAGRRLRFWWRDDDAIKPTAELDRFLSFCSDHRIPVALATIASTTTPELATHVKSLASVDILVHGFRHQNHASPTEKKAEFGAHRPLQAMEAEAAEGLARVRGIFGARMLPVFVPPWNRISSKCVAVLPSCGYQAVSTFNRRPSPLAAPGLQQINTHFDPIAWHAGGGLADEGVLYDRLADLIGQELAAPPQILEPIGVLTHHLVHDGWIDRFLRELVDRLTASGMVRFVSIRDALAAEKAR